MSTKSKIKELIGRDLGGFKIIEMTEVFKQNEVGEKIISLGFFKDPDTAVAFTRIQKDPDWWNTGQTLVLTDGTVCYPIRERNPVKLDDKDAIVEIKKQAVAKLTRAECKLLGLE